MTDHDRNLARFLLGQLAAHPPEAFVSALASMRRDAAATNTLPATIAEAVVAAVEDGVSEVRLVDADDLKTKGQIE